MTCPYCHSKIDDTNKYCNYCGKKVTPNEHENQFEYSNAYSNSENKETENHDDQYSYSMLYSNMYNKTASSDEDYLKTYVGKNYYLIKNEKLSVPALLLGPLYLFYRKLWLRAAILVIVELALASYHNSNITFLINIIIAVYLGFKFNSFYLQHAEKEIEQIKISNPDKTSTELLAICQKKGGTASPTAVMVIILAFIFISTLITIPAMSFYLYSNNSTSKKVEKEETEKYKTLENMTYEVPKDTKSSEYNNDNYHYYLSLTKSDNDCTFTLSTNKYTNLYKTADEYINKNIFKSSNSKELVNTTTKINNVNWRFLSIASDSRTENYYVTIYNNTLYIVEIRGFGESKTSNCKNAENDLMNSIVFKQKQ